MVDFISNGEMFLAFMNQRERKFCPQIQRVPNGIWHTTFPVTLKMKRAGRDALSEGGRHLQV